MKLEVALLAGPETKAVLVELKSLVDRLESLTKGGVVAKPATPAATQAAVDEFDSEPAEVEAEAETASDDDFMSEPEPKPTKAKKITAKMTLDWFIRRAHTAGTF